MALTQHALDHFATTWCLPTMLLLNFACFQYLVTLFHRRAREPRVLLLLGIAAMGVVALVPFATQSEATVGRMNDLSESCLALLLLVQTALVGSRTSATPLRSPSKLLHLLADVVIVYDLIVVALGLVSVFQPSVVAQFGGAATVNNVAENLTLAFTFVYRFSLLRMAKKHGVRALLQDDGWELLWHVVFATHEYVFMLVEARTSLSWEFIQAVYMRLTLLPCVWMTIGDHHAFHVRRRKVQDPCHGKPGSSSSTTTAGSCSSVTTATATPPVVVAPDSVALQDTTVATATTATTQ